MRRALVVSIVVHLGCLLPLALVRRRLPPRADRAPSTTIVEYRESGRPRSDASRSRRPTKHPNARARASSAPGLSPDHLRFEPGRGADSSPAPLAEDTSGWAPDQWGAGGGGGLANVIHARAYGKLIAEIDEVLHYPRVLGDRRISGVFNARLTFAAGSRCAWPPRITGAHPYLRVYVLAVLRKVCGFESSTTMGFGAGQIVDLSFAFVLTDGPDARPSPGRVAGNVLMFERTHPADRLGYRIGPVKGVWFVPAVALDWGWVVDHWEKWFEGKDPLDAFRD